jgi:hypothetical protein
MDKIVIVGAEEPKIKPKKCLVYSEQEVADRFFLLPRDSGGLLPKVTCDQLFYKQKISRKQITDSTKAEEVIVIDHSSSS